MTDAIKTEAITAEAAHPSTAEEAKKSPVKTFLTELRGCFRGVGADCMALCAYILCMPFTVVPTPFGSLLKVVTYGVCLVMAWTTFVGNTKPMKPNIVHLTYTLYAIYTISEFTFFRSVKAQEVTVDMLTCVIVLPLFTMRVYNKNEHEFLETIWIIEGVMCAYLCLTSSTVFNETEDRSVIGVFGYTEDPNEFCAYFIFPVLLCIKRIIEKRPLMPLYAVLLLAMYYAILKTGSRGGLLGVSVGVIFCVFIAIRGVKSKILFIVLGVLMLFVVIKVIMPLLPESITARYNINEVIESKGTHRFTIWEYTLQYLSEKPERLIRGCGVLSSYEVFALTREIRNGVCHNQFIQVLLDQGIIGETMYLSLIFSGIFRNIKRNPYYSCAYLSICAFAMSLTTYLHKPSFNVVVMCALNFDDSAIPMPKKGEDKPNGETNIF